MSLSFIPYILTMSFATFMVSLTNMLIPAKITGNAAKMFFSPFVFW